MKAFGDVKGLAALKGKVVVLDFWATWCPYCIMSFPAIRDLLRDYEDVVVVGVTATHSFAYEQRYALDEDLRKKGKDGERASPSARRTPPGRPASGKNVFSEEEYPAKEQEVIAWFIANHEMTWPVVMIDKSEPREKYALSGWPHAVVLDCEGRVRHFKPGALMRSDTNGVKAFRAVIDAQMAAFARDEWTERTLEAYRKSNLFSSVRRGFFEAVCFSG